MNKRIRMEKSVMNLLNRIPMNFHFDSSRAKQSIRDLWPPLFAENKTVIIGSMGMEIDSGSNGALTLLIDADDTLWENNIYFERAIARFISFLNHHEYSPEQVREILNEVERENIVTHGYGLHSFAHALVACFERLSADPVTPELHDRIHSFAHAIADHPVEILPNVPETLQHLASRHHLILMTKGAFAEQSGKVERSGLKDYFRGNRDRSRKR